MISGPARWKKLNIYLLLLLVSSPVVPTRSVKFREDGAYQLPINLDGSLQNPSFSPDGRAIVFTRFRNGYNRGPADIFTYNLSSGHLHKLVEDGSDNVNLPGHIWMDNVIVFSSSREPHDEIYRISPDNAPGNEIKITSRPDLVAYEPSLSYDGTWVVFESHLLDHEDDGVITKYPMDGSSDYVALTPSAVNAKEPNCSPRSDLIVYQRVTSGIWQLWLMQGDGTKDSPLTYSDSPSTDASFSADGDWIVFSQEIPEKDAANLFRITVNGTIMEKLTTFGGYDGAPSLYNTSVVFESYPGDPDDSEGTTIWLRDISQPLISSYASIEDNAGGPILMLTMVCLVLVNRFVYPHKRR